MGTKPTKQCQQSWVTEGGQDYLQLITSNSATPMGWIDSTGTGQGNLASGGGSSPNFSDAETPAGLINSSNTTYTLAHAPNPAACLQLYHNGLMNIAGGVDYTLSGSTITYGSAPSTGDYLVAYYRY
jgi:hypothetical protein